MIISHKHRFVFFHNPKAGGTSVRATIERFNDVGFGMWGVDPERSGPPVDRAHMGIDEFAADYSELWQKVRGYAGFCLVRDPQARFLSSISEHAKLHGDTDVRFASPEARTDVLKRTLDRLRAFDNAEALMDIYEFTHFRPQWIYWRSSDPAMKVTPHPVTNMEIFFSEIAKRTGEPIEAQKRNTRESLNLPGPMAALAAHGGLRRALGSFPGMELAKKLVRKQYTAEGDARRESFPMSPDLAAEVSDFVRMFYAQDFKVWPVALAPKGAVAS